MNSTLDQSHRTVLANFGTFQRAQQCVEEIKSYMWDVLREVADELPENADPPVKFVLDKGGWLQANTFSNWDGSGFDLISIGIENFTLADVLAADGAEGCRAYIYSLLLNDPARATANKAVAARLRTLQPPDGFAPAPLNMHGYLFVKKLGAVPVDSLCSRSLLKGFLSNPLNELGAWLEAHKGKIASFGATSGKKSDNDTPATVV